MYFVCLRFSAYAPMQVMQSNIKHCREKTLFFVRVSKLNLTLHGAMQWDDENPLVREYGLWAVRNLCEGNDAIQDSISSLRAHSTVDSPELQQIGMKIELDGKTGKPKMVAQGA